MSNTITDSPHAEPGPASTYSGSKTIDDDNVYPAFRTDFEDTASIIAALQRQETRSALDESNCCNAGDHGFRTYKTDLPVVRNSDIEPGLLLYRPTTSPLLVYEVTSEPYVNEYGSRQVDVTVHSRAHAGDDPDLKQHDESVFVSMIVDKLSIIQRESVQTTITGDVA